jgi:hypothetical protein
VLLLKVPHFIQVGSCKNNWSYYFNHQKSDQDELIIGKINFKTFDLGGHETGKFTSIISFSSSTAHLNYFFNSQLASSGRITLRQELMVWSSSWIRLIK